MADPYCKTNPEFDKWLRHLGDLHDRKNAGYAGSVDGDPYANFRLSERFGVPGYVGVAVRLSDKLMRLFSLLRNPDNDRVGEGLLDLADDVAVYAGIFKGLYEEYLKTQKMTDTFGAS